ncbi:MAG TPA: SDR family NAD(P)-dependent oxidoreductase, partial [Amaricoccus sp.]|nr:SDR family NAD(P)-dependent oxidoreductase [Amaricoccus sp.]
MTGVLVTGGAAGIGWAIARAFAARGDRVAIIDLDGAAAAARAAELGPEHLGLGGDVTDEGSVQAVVDQADAALGGLGAVVNNAGIGDDPAATLDQDLAR